MPPSLLSEPEEVTMPVVNSKSMSRQYSSEYMPSLCHYWIILCKVIITTSLLRANTLKTKIMWVLLVRSLRMVKEIWGSNPFTSEYLKGLVFINANISVNSQNHTA